MIGLEQFIIQSPQRLGPNLLPHGPLTDFVVQVGLSQ